MTLWSNSYHLLVSSLPPLPTRLEAGRLPITAERLQSRLRLLEPEDAREMQGMFDVLRWTRQFEESHDAAVVKRYDELMGHVTNRVVREVLTDQMDARMITTALRRRRRGMGPPPLGIGQWSDQIRHRFTQPDFGLGHVDPLYSQLAPLFEQGDVLAVHRGLMQGHWRYLKQRADNYYFSFEAVVLYVARWNMLRDWQELRADRGRPVFDKLVEEALGDYANVYA